MRVKFNGGPNHRKVEIVPDGPYGGEHLLFTQIQPPDWRSYSVNGDIPEAKRREGRYSRTEKRLKDGTWIYQWMGWTDEH